MNCPQVLPYLKRVIGGEVRALLHRFDLLHPLVDQMVTQSVLAEVEISDQDLDHARLELLQERGYGRLEQWSELLNEIGRSDQQVVDRMAAVIRRQSLIPSVPLCQSNSLSPYQGVCCGLIRTPLPTRRQVKKV